MVAEGENNSQQEGWPPHAPQITNKTKITGLNNKRVSWRKHLSFMNHSSNTREKKGGGVTAGSLLSPFPNESRAQNPGLSTARQKAAERSWARGEAVTTDVKSYGHNVNGSRAKMTLNLQQHHQNSIPWLKWAWGSAPGQLLQPSQALPGDVFQLIQLTWLWLCPQWCPTIQQGHSAFQRDRGSLGQQIWCRVSQEPPGGVGVSLAGTQSARFHQERARRWVQALGHIC